jgi:hypothetical protein
VVRKGAQQGGFQPKTGEAPEPQLLHHIRSYSTSDDPTVELATVMQLRDGVWGESTRPPIATFRRQVYAVLVDHARLHRRRDESAQGGPGVEGPGWSWVLVEEGEGHRSKAMVVVDVVARERQLASVEQQGKRPLDIRARALFSSSCHVMDALCKRRPLKPRASTPFRRATRPCPVPTPPDLTPPNVCVPVPP